MQRSLVVHRGPSNIFTSRRIEALFNVIRISERGLSSHTRHKIAEVALNQHPQETVPAGAPVVYDGL
jgi:hypothetical protein